MADSAWVARISTSEAVSEWTSIVFWFSHKISGKLFFNKLEGNTSEIVPLIVLCQIWRAWGLAPIPKNLTRFQHLLTKEQVACWERLHLSSTYLGTISSDLVLGKPLLQCSSVFQLQFHTLQQNRKIWLLFQRFLRQAVHEQEFKVNMWHRHCYSFFRLISHSAVVICK